MLKLHEGITIKGITLNVSEMCQVHTFYERAYTQEYIVENYPIYTEEQAWDMAYEVRERMEKGLSEAEAVEEIVKKTSPDLSSFVKVGNNREEAYKDFSSFEEGFDEEFRTNISFEDFCKELDEGYGKASHTQIQRLYEDNDGVIWYDNEYV